MELPIGWMSKWYAILMGIEHERIHLETSSVLIRQLPLSAVHQTPQKDSGTNVWYNKCDGGIFDKSIDFKPNLGAPDHSPLNELIPLKASSDVEYGRPTEQRNLGSENLSDYMVPVYGWDNEFGEAIITDVPKFSVSKYLVSNEEYYEFVLDNGYNRKEFWTDEGWRWKTSVNAEYPKFWVKENNEWKYRNMLDTMDLPWDWPVITNQLEAHAFTQWKTAKTGKNIRLPTEDEWFAMRKGFAFGFDRDNNDNNDEDFSIFIEEQPMWDVAPGNTNFEFFASENPVDMFEFGDTGLYDVVGNVWQHTLTPQHPFKGFHVHPWYDDFTVPCFGSMHNMLKGGSWISTGNEAMSYSRYQFRRHFFQFAGIRYVESDRDLSFLDVLADSTPYNSDMVVDMYTHFHYWDEKYFGVQNYALTVGRTAIKYMNESMHGKALDLGCATGRSSFELATVFDDVTGIDFTARLISIGYRLKIDKELDWKVPIQGEIMQSHRVTLEELGYNEEIADKVEFYQNDAQNLDEQYTGYDLVVASNLIDRLSNPMLFLTSIHERINKYGKLVLLSPYTWLEEYAPKERWIGAKYKTVKKEDGSTEEVAVYTVDMLKEILSQWFTFEGEEHVEMVIRETANKFQHTKPHATIWTRK